MLWLNVWDSLKNKICRYLLQRYLGRFLDDKLRLEQLKVELYNGKATVQNVTLNVETLNELFEEQGWAVEVIGGYIGELIVTVPWNALMINNSSIEVSGLVICFRPIQRQSKGTSMLESMWSSVSSSMQLAEECIKQDMDIMDRHSSVQVIDGLEKFAETIDNVLNRITAKFSNTTIRLEQQLQDKHGYIGLSIQIKMFHYKNESGNETWTLQTSNLKEKPNSLNVLLSTFAKHNIVLSGIEMYTEEYTKNDACGDISPLSPSTNEKKLETVVVPILKIKGQQKATIKIKQSEEISGPKILIDLELGAINSILTPRQVHLILQVLRAFDEQELSNYTQIITKKSCLKNKIEDSENQIGTVLNESIMWGESNEKISVAQRSDTSENLSSIANKYSDSPESSVSPGSTITSSSRFQRKLANMESCGEIVKFNVRSTSCALHILHEDITFESSSAYLLNENSFKSLLKLSQDFFKEWTDEYNEGERVKPKSLQGKNYHYISLSPIVLDGIQQRNKNVLLLKLSGTSTKTYINEVLQGVENPLLLFDRNENCSQGHQKRPDITFLMKSTSCCSENLTKVALDVNIKESTLELDISIYDRLSVLLGPSPFARFDNSVIMETFGDHNKPSTEINLDCNLLHVNLRFPIVDSRPIHDPNRLPWWKQNIRDDFLQFDIYQLRCTLTLYFFNFLMNSVDLSYCEDQKSKVHFLRASLTKQEPSNLNRLESLKINVKLKNDPITTKRGSTSNDSAKSQSTRTPFSSQRACRQSDTVHKKRGYPEPDTILLPGDREELKDFRNSTIDNSTVQIQTILPNIIVIMQSKQFYEILYNRLSFNLFLWEPCSPVFTNCNESHIDNQHILTLQMQDAFDVDLEKKFQERDKCKEKYNSKRDGSESHKGPKNIHFPTLANNCFKPLENRYCSIEILIHKARLTCFVPIRHEENVLPEHCGRIELCLSDFQIFAAIGYGGIINLDYMIFQLGTLELFHCGLIPENCSKLFSENSSIPHYMQRTVHKVPPGLIKGTSTNNNRDMLSLVLEIKRNPVQRIKRIRATAGLQSVALQYIPELSSHLWLNQIIDFLDIQELTTDGYQPFGVLTEIQWHVWDFAVDYRPTTFDYRAVVELGTFSMSSNIISTNSGCCLRFIVEDFVLEIAPNVNKIDDDTSSLYLLKTDLLVPVLDVGLLDVSVRIGNEISKTCPKFDLRCSIYDANLRTCSDSGKVMAQLIAYIAKDGDLRTRKEIQERPFHQLSNLSGSTPHKPRNDLNSVTEQQQERVNSMMAEAVQDNTPSIDVQILPNEDQETQKRGIEVFYFPDEEPKLFRRGYMEEDAQNRDELTDLVNFESTVMSNTRLRKVLAEDTLTLSSVKEDLGDINNETNINKTSDDEFCFISENEKIFKHRGNYNVQVSNEPLRIVDNHFRLPIDKSDLLAAPDDFPIPETRYTICEMTFTWYLYGGDDFPKDLTSDGNPNTKMQSKMSEAYKYGVSYSKNVNNVKLLKNAKEKLTWKRKGGPQRNHQVLVEINFSKIRFSHEEYPIFTSHASRQVFLVNEIEIRDRLQSSEINKFLYHLNINSLANKRQQQMLVIKALHVRTNSRNNSDKECSLRISLLPLRLHIDQDTLIFLVEFFSNLGSSPVIKKESGAFCYSAKSDKNKKLLNPIMEVDEVPEAVQDLRSKNDLSTHLDFLVNNAKEEKTSVCDDNLKEQSSQTKPIYFRELVFSPEVSIRIDYHGRRVELSRGPITGLIMGLGQLQCSEIRLRKLLYRRGLLGTEKLLTFMCKEWLKDIKKNQLPKILSGVGPTYAFVQLFQGVYDLFWMPIEQYQKDGRLVKGIQLGAQSFTARTALAALEITSRVISILQLTAETAFDMVSPGPSVRRYVQSQKGKRKRPNRPRDLREGVNNAYIILKEGINESAANLIETASIENDHKGYTGAVGAVVRQIPQLMICPAVLATQATSNILGGVRNSLVPEAKNEAREKWKEINE